MSASRYRAARLAAAQPKATDSYAEEWGRAQLYTDPAVVNAFITDLKRAGMG